MLKLVPTVNGVWMWKECQSESYTNQGAGSKIPTHYPHNAVSFQYISQKDLQQWNTV